MASSTAFLTGFPFMMTIIFLPQRLQLQNGLSPVRAGINMLALLLLSATGAALSGILISKHNISWYLLAGSLGLQMIGLGLMSTLPATGGPVPSAQFGYQALLGLGFGLALSSLAILARVEVDERDISTYMRKAGLVGNSCIDLASNGMKEFWLTASRYAGIVMGAITQVRVLGGVIGIAIGQVIISSRLTSELGPVLGPEKLAALLHSTAAIKTFSPEEAALAMECYGRAFNLQNKIMIGFAAAGVVACAGAWKRHFENGADLEKKRLEAKARKMASLQAGDSVQSRSSPPQINMTWGESDDFQLWQFMRDK